MTGKATSVAMTATTEKALLSQLVRADSQEDLCLATYRPSTGMTRVSALITELIPPEPGDRFVHGNATVTAEYILRGIEIAQSNESGLVLLHSHPGSDKWQFMSEPDRDTESSYANLVREVTGLPLVGMTLATSSVPVAKPAGQPPPLAPLLCDIQHGVQHLKVGQPNVATLNREDWSYAFVLSFCNFHTCIVSNSSCFV